MEMDFEQLYNTYYMQVYSFVLALSRNRDISEEITQKTFFRAITAGKKYAGNSSELTWLCAIAKNLFTDELRLQKKTCVAETEEKASGISVESAVMNEDSAFQIHQVLHNLEEPYKEVFQLRVFGELSFQKIGKLHSRSVQNDSTLFEKDHVVAQSGDESGVMGSDEDGLKSLEFP